MSLSWCIVQKYLPSTDGPHDVTEEAAGADEGGAHRGVLRLQQLIVRG